MTYDSGATFNRINSMINVLNNYDINVVGKIKFPSNFSKKKISFHFVNQNSIFNSNNFILRYFNEFIYSYKCIKVSKKLNPDYELITVPFISLIITSSIFGSNAKKIIDIRDLVWEYSDTSFFSKILFNFLKKIHLFFLKKCDVITLSNKYELDQLKKDKINNKMIVLSNGISKSKFNFLKSSVFNDINSRKNIVITYLGNVGLAQNLWPFIYSIKQYQNMVFNVVGDGNDLDRLKKLSKKYNIKNVKFYGNVDFNMVLNFYKKTDYLYAKLDKKFVTAIPSKLYEYLATGKPIIYSGYGAAIKLLEKFDNIYIIKDDKYSINNLLKSLSSKKPYNSKNNIQIINELYIRENNYKALANIAS